MQSEVNENIFIALTSHGEEFVEVLEGEFLENDPSDFVAIDSYIQHHFKPIKGKVSINGNVYLTTVYTPVSENDFCYVKADLNKVPVDSYALRVKNSVELDCYLANLRKTIDKTEAFSDDLELRIDDYFVKPDFRVLNREKIGKVSWDYLSSFSRLMIVGSPGSGKTTCMRKLALDFAKNESADGLGTIVPIYFSMRHFGDREFSYSSIQEIFSAFEAPELAKDIRALMVSGSVILFLDGFDEINDTQRDKILKQIRTIGAENPRMRMAISMRYSYKQQEFEDFTQLEVVPFDDFQIKHWTYQVIKDKKPWKEFISHLIETPEILELARNPLMLSTAISLFLRYSHTPHNRIALMERYLDVLIEDWDSVRNVNRSNEIWSSPNKKIFYLCNLAHHLNREDKSHFTIHEFKKWNEDLLEKTSEHTLLRSLAEDTGLLRWYGEDRWKFTHKSTLEYLAARYLVDCTVDVNEFFKEKLTHTRYQNVWSNVCGIAYDSSRLINSMLTMGDISPEIKLILLSAIFTEEIKTNEQLALSYSQYIKLGIEKHLENAVLKNFDDSNLQDAEDISVDNSLIIEFGKANKPSNEIILFINLMKNLYKLKSTIMGQLLQRALMESSVQLVNQVESILHWHGELNYKIVEKDTTVLVAFFGVNADSKENILNRSMRRQLKS